MDPTEAPEPPELGPALATLTDDLRKMGLYVEYSVELQNETESEYRLLMIDCLIGDIAFSDRVIRPEQDAIDREVAEMEIGMVRSSFEDATEKLRRRLAEGKPLLGDD